MDYPLADTVLYCANFLTNGCVSFILQYLTQGLVKMSQPRGLNVSMTQTPWSKSSAMPFCLPQGRCKGPLARYVKLRVAHTPGMSRVTNPDMSWCMLGSLASGFFSSRRREKRSGHSRCMRNLHFYVSVKRPMSLLYSFCNSRVMQFLLCYQVTTHAWSACAASVWSSSWQQRSRRVCLMATRIWC